MIVIIPKILKISIDLLSKYLIEINFDVKFKYFGIRYSNFYVIYYFYFYILIKLKYI